MKGITAVDTIGAGDNFCIRFHKSCLKKDIRECAKYANVTASISVQSTGATGGGKEPRYGRRTVERIRSAVRAGIKSSGRCRRDYFMRYMELGSSGRKISKWVLAHGNRGGPAWNGDLDERVCIDTIVKAVDARIDLIDTAPGYNFRNSEIIVGKALKKLTKKVCLVTKCGIVWEREGALFNKVGDRQLYKLLTPESIRKKSKILFAGSRQTISTFTTHLAGSRTVLYRFRNG